MEQKDLEEVWELMFNVLFIVTDFPAFYNVMRCSWEHVCNFPCHLEYNRVGVSRKRSSHILR